MMKTNVQTALEIARCFLGEEHPRNPNELCSALGITVINNRQLNNEGYLICSDGQKLIFVSSGVTNLHRRNFVVAHELGHFLMHHDKLYCCTDISLSRSFKTNTHVQEGEANQFASEFLLPQAELKPMIPKQSLTMTDIQTIASHFDVSITHAAMKAVQNSNTEDEILLCYDGDKLKWYEANGSNLYSRIPQKCPITLYKNRKKSSVSGVWDGLYEGGVRQEVFHTYRNNYLVLLSGKRKSYDW